jgi:hypothetical protein
MENGESTMDLAEPKSSLMNFLQRLGGAYFEPVKTFQAINRKPAWLAIFMVSAVLSMADDYVVSIRVDMAEIARKSLELMEINLSEKQLNQMEELAAAEENRPVFRALGLLQRPAMSILRSLMISGIFMLTFLIMKTPLRYKKVFAITMWGFAVPSLIGQILSMFVLFLKESYTVDSREAILMSNLGFILDSKAHPFLQSLASSLDVFSIWTICLLSIGFYSISERKLTRGRVATGIVVLWLVFVICRAGVRTMIAGLSGMSR